MGLFDPETGSAVLAGEPSLVFEILTDYDAYAEWMPFVTSSKLLAQEGDDLAIAEIAVNLGEPETLAIECIHDRDRMVLSRGIGGSLPVAKIEWNLSPQGAGKCKVEVSMHPEERWQTFLPGHRKFLNPGACLESLRRRVALYDESAVPSIPGAEQVLVIRETPEGLMARYLGKEYKMTPLEQA